MKSPSENNRQIKHSYTYALYLVAKLMKLFQISKYLGNDIADYPE
jgi:hypothetical protein